jgi:hypothetical protein
MTADLHFTDHGSIWLMEPRTDAARAWVAEHIPEDAQSFGHAIVVEPRYVEAIVIGATADGLECINLGRAMERLQ